MLRRWHRFGGERGGRARVHRVAASVQFDGVCLHQLLGDVGEGRVETFPVCFGFFTPWFAEQG
eukprot:3872905-Lingulodinium_polyedra.AAC.1